MAKTGSIRNRHIVEITDLDGNVLTYDKAKTVESLIDIRPINFQIAASSTVTIYDPTDIATQMQSFDYLYLLSDIDLFLEVYTDEDDDIGRTIHAPLLKADIGYVLGSNIAIPDTSHPTHPADDLLAEWLTSANEDVIDRIRVREVNGVAGSLIGVMGSKI